MCADRISVLLHHHLNSHRASAVEGSQPPVKNAKNPAANRNYLATFDHFLFFLCLFCINFVGFSNHNCFHPQETAYSKWRIIRSRKMFFSKTWIGQGGGEFRGRPWVVLQLMKEALDGANMETCTMMGRQTEHTTQQENKSSEVKLLWPEWNLPESSDENICNYVFRCGALSKSFR